MRCLLGLDGVGNLLLCGLDVSFQDRLQRGPNLPQHVGDDRAGDFPAHRFALPRFVGLLLLLVGEQAFEQADNSQNHCRDDIEFGNELEQWKQYGGEGWRDGQRRAVAIPVVMAVVEGVVDFG